MSIFDGIDMSDPCAVAPKLEAALDRLLAGEMTVKARFGKDEVEYQQVDVPALRSRIRELRTQCAARGGRSPVAFVNFRSNRGW